MSITDQINREMKEVSDRGSFFKAVEGENKIRILSEGSIIATHWVNDRPFPCYGETKGCPRHGFGAPKDKDGKPQMPQVKYTCYVLDRTDNKVKLADLPYSVIKSVGDLQNDADWAFSEFPMPYDIKIIYYKKDPATGKPMAPANMYKLIASPNRALIEQEHVDSLRKLLETANPVDLVKKKKDAQLNADRMNGTWIEPVGLSEEEKARIQELRENAMKPKEVDPDAIDPNDIPF